MRRALSRSVAISIIAAVIVVGLLGAYAANLTLLTPSTNTTFSSSASSSSSSLPPSGSVSSSFTTVTITSSHHFPTVSNQNQSFQFVDARPQSSHGGSVILTSRFVNNLGTRETVTLVGVAYPAAVDNISSIGTICCPMIQSYSSYGSSRSTAQLDANPKSVVSANLTFTSLKDGPYLVKLHIVSSNGTSLSPTLNLFLSVSSAGLTCGGQEGAGSIFVDQDNGMVYVANSGTDSLTVINGYTGAIDSTIPLPDLIGSLTFYVYDHGNKELYVGSSFSNEVFAINTSSNYVVNKMIVSRPNQSLVEMIYDPLNGKIFGINFVYSQILAINDSTNKIIANITSVQPPVRAWFDPTNGDIYVEAYNGTIYAMNGDNYSIASKIVLPTAYYSSSLLFDPDEGVFYTSWNNTLSMINATSNTLMESNITLPSSGYRPVLYDPANKDLYVYGGNQLLAIDTTLRAVVGNISLRGVNGGLVQQDPTFFYDPSSGNLYATTDMNPQSGTTGLVQIAKNNTLISDTVLPDWSFIDLNGGGLAFDPMNNVLYGTTGNSSVSLYSINQGNANLLFKISVGTCSVGYLLP